MIAGDYNADPLDGDSRDAAIDQLLDLPQVNTTVTPSSEGGAEQAALQGGVNLEHLDDPALDTADFGEPPEADALFRLVGTYPFPTSDHRSSGWTSGCRTTADVVAVTA